MMAEGSETPNGEQGAGPEGRARRSEGDLFAERRARRAAESGEIALTRRAEAAEATVQTLESHVASLQQRLREAQDEHERIDELLEAERAAVLEREHELRLVKQREYAEQQLRVEAEGGLADAVELSARIEREGRVELERLGARLSASEQQARELAQRLQDLQLQLAEVEQDTAAERDAVRRGEQQLQVRLSEAERRTLEVERGLDGERAARERSERLLESMGEGHRRMELLLGEMRGLIARLTAAFAQGPQPSLGRQAIAVGAPEARGAEMADALAAAVGRLRARAETAAPAAEALAPVAAGEPAEPQPTEPATSPLDAPLPRAPEQAHPGAGVPRAAVVQQASHKHSLSWFARRRIKRKQRRERRSQ